ncbi:MAG: hypothetical protein II288_01960 [Alistipes sp.]|jgi:hypothetical protein|nr:hypothetical protein [Alistipes sp.]
MYKYLSYIWLALLVLFVQIFLLDNIDIGASFAVWVRPMIFPIIVLLLPMELKNIWVILAAYAVGMAMDVSLGGSGLYVATLLPLSLVRSTLLYMTTRRSVEMGDQTELLSRLSVRQLMYYVTAALLLYHALFFFMEALTFSGLMRLVATIIFSTAVSLLVAWPIIRMFLSKVVAR